MHRGTLGWGGRLRLIGHEWRHHPGRLVIAVLAIALGVALALAVQLINRSALAEFGAALRSLNGEPDAELRPASGDRLPEALYPQVADWPELALASPVLEIDTLLFDRDGQRQGLKLLGLDALIAPALAPALLPRPSVASRTALVDPGLVYLNPAARALLPADAEQLELVASGRRIRLRLGGTVAAPGGPLAVMDIAGAQAAFGRLGEISRLDLRLAPGHSLAELQPRLAAAGPAAGQTALRLAAPQEAALRLSNLSRAYRVNLGVLALVALFTGAFLVYSVQALAVAKRVPQLALLGVLGLDARERARLVLAEAAAIGLLGAALGVALGAGLAALALQRLGGDLGSGLLGAAAGGGAPPLQWSTPLALLYGGLGLAAALLGSGLPARRAAAIAPAQALKGLGELDQRPRRPWLGPLLLLAAPLLALLPPVAGLPLAAYGAVVLILLGGIAIVPAGVAWLLARLPMPRQPLVLLALERSRDQRHSATIAVAGVLASLALAVALTVMVASFRDSVTRWLDQVLPADLYARSALSSGQAAAVFFPPDFVAAAAALPGVARLQTQRLVPLVLDAQRAPATLIARELAADPARVLPLTGALVEPPASAAGLPRVYASEALAALFGAQAGRVLALPLPDGRQAEVWVHGLWRDYARQQGALVIARADWQALSGDTRVNDLALWLQAGAAPAEVDSALHALAERAGVLIETATPAAIRASSLAIFDRSFAVTTWLQAVAIAIGLAGIAASFSAQVLARRREFGTLRHLGLARRQVLTLVTAEGALWTGFGTLLGLALGLAVSLVLVKVVNPQSFHWTMDLSLPVGRLALLTGAVLAAGSLTALLAGRAAAGQDMVLAVKEDW